MPKKEGGKERRRSEIMMLSLLLLHICLSSRMSATHQLHLRNYRRYILNQDEDSQLRKFFDLQLKHRSKGDWASTCLDDLKEPRITESLEEMKQMNANNFMKILKCRNNENA